MVEALRVAPEKLRRVCEFAKFDFKSTAELSALNEVIGQERAVEAVAFGIDIESPGYHIFALGPSGTGKSTTVRKFLENHAPSRQTPDEWVYVNNFSSPDKPRALKLAPGKGCELRDDMKELIKKLKTEVPQAFRSEDYQKEQENIKNQFQQKQQKILQELEKKARKEGFTVIKKPRGLLLAPVIEGEVMSPEQLNKLDKKKRKKLGEKRDKLKEDLREALYNLRKIKEKSQERIQKLDQEVVEFSVSYIVKKLKEKYADHPEVKEYLELVEKDVLDRVGEFKKLNQPDQQQPPGFFQDQREFLKNYEVNLMVDNCEQQGAPVVVESNPTYYNLLGRIEHVGKLGMMMTDFTQLKPGALHRANGGFLIVEARELLTKPFAWESLKRSLKNRQIKTESMGMEYRPVQMKTLEPEPIPLDLKVVIIGDPLLYYLLYRLDEDFQELFKVKADFSVQTDWVNETEKKYLNLIAEVCEEEQLLHFSPEGAGRMIEHCSRLAGDQRKLDIKLGDIVDLIREASYWGRKANKELVDSAAVETAINKRIYRSNRLEERQQELIEQGTILIDTDGAEPGQVNGISVLPLGDYSFGKPSRITARSFVGDGGVVNIDREIELGGPVHNKGVMILTGYLGSKFAGEAPLSLSASITFEQLYSEVEGDSASSAELYALLSSLSELPLRQDLAVTGSVNQRGQIQAIGGVNEKIEGFFKSCENCGLTGKQGVIIPESNVENLMLNNRVTEAINRGEFNLYAISGVTQGIELLTGKPAGERQEDGSYPEGTVFYRVQKQLIELAEKGKNFSKETED